MSKSKARKVGSEPVAGVIAPPAVVDPSLILAEKVKELVRLAKEQGQLTFDDVGEILTEEHTNPANLDHVFAKLRELEIEVVDAAEVDRVKPIDKEEPEEDEGRMDAL